MNDKRRRLSPQLRRAWRQIEGFSTDDLLELNRMILDQVDKDIASEEAGAEVRPKTPRHPGEIVVPISAAKDDDAKQ